MNKGVIAALVAVLVGGVAFMLTQEKPAKEEKKAEEAKKEAKRLKKEEKQRKKEEEAAYAARMEEEAEKEKDFIKNVLEPREKEVKQWVKENTNKKTGGFHHGL